MLEGEGVLEAQDREEIDREAVAQVDRAVAFAEDSPFPAAESLYEDVYVVDEQVRGTYH
jgi:TPP-dependent pyruvate/acetoin dehydrogenase alpha subunit